MSGSVQDFSSDSMADGGASSVYAPREKRFPWGCLLGGCLGVFLLMLIGVGAAGWAGYSFYRAQLEKYTSPEPVALPVVEMDDAEIAAIEKRVEDFQSQVDAGDAPEQLILTADDINALISKQEKLRGKVFVGIENSELSAEVSFPMDGLPGGKGRYFNGSVTADVALKDGILIVTMAEASVNGNPVPEEIMQALRRENLAKDMYKDPKVAKKLGRFESIVIDEDRIVLTLKQKQDEGTETKEGEQPGDAEENAGADATSNSQPDESQPDESQPDESQDSEVESEAEITGDELNQDNTTPSAEPPSDAELEPAFT